MNKPDTNPTSPRMETNGSPATRGAAIAYARTTVGRFLSRGGFNGRSESIGGAGESISLSDDDVRQMASNVAEAARNDPVAFGILGEAKSEVQVRDHIAGAVEAIRKDGRDAKLTKNQRSALEAIILLTGRPAFFIKDDAFELPTGLWEMLAPYRPQMSTVIRSVGRIGVSMDYGTPYVGTGFVVGEKLIMTNRHVVSKFAARSADGWVLDPGCRMVIDFKQEFGVADKVEFPIEGVVWIDERENVDLAVLKLAASARSVPTPLRLQKELGYANVGNNVYVVGYPAADPTRNDPAESQRIFGGVYEKKRLSPGRILSIDLDKLSISHDCSTLGGSSGSCVVDLSTNSVIGLHFEGNYLSSNSAVLLPHLASESRFSALNFREGRDA